MIALDLETNKKRKATKWLTSNDGVLGSRMTNNCIAVFRIPQRVMGENWAWLLSVGRQEKRGCRAPLIVVFSASGYSDRVVSASGKGDALTRALDIRQRVR